ncbi:hypothetical protein ACP275_09G056300 [Erythranthe tilingii]
MVRSFNNQHLVLIFILIIGLQKSLSLARRQVKEVNEVIITDEKQYTSAVGDSNISLEKESVDAITNAAEIEARGRKMSMEKRTKKMRKEKKVSLMGGSISSAAKVENNVLGKRKGDDHDHIGGEEDKNWKDDFMAFSADYRSAKSHPPKNN